MVAEMSTENSTHDRKLAQVSLYFQTVANGVRTHSQFPLSVTVTVTVPLVFLPGHQVPPLRRTTSDVRLHRRLPPGND